MNFQNMTDDELLFTIGEMQKEYISRVHPEMGEGVTQVIDALPQASVFYNDTLEEALITGVDFIIAVDDEGNTVSVEPNEEGKIYWQTGWEC